MTALVAALTTIILIAGMVPAHMADPLPAQEELLDMR